MTKDLIERGHALAAVALGDTVNQLQAKIREIPRAPAHDPAAIREALLSLPAVYAHQINTGVREVYDPLQRFYRMEDVLSALITEKPHDRA